MAGAVLPVLPAPPAGSAPAPRVVYARSVDGGAGFESRATLSVGPSELADVGAEGGHVHVVWHSGAEPREVHYRHSPDGGEDFEDPVNVSDNKGDSRAAALALSQRTSGSVLHVAWQDDVLRSGRPDSCCPDDEVYHRRALDDGPPFEAITNVSDSEQGHSRDPDIDASPALVGVVYEEDVEEPGSPENEQILFRRSTDGGGSWFPPVDLMPGDRRAAEPSVALDGGTVHVVAEMRGARGDGDRLVYIRSLDGGAGFEAPVLLPPGAERGGVIAAEGGVLHVAGCRRSAPGDLFYYRSTDNGETWNATVNLSDDEGECHRPSLDVAGDFVAIAWGVTTPGNEEIFFRRSVDGGTTFEPAINVSHDPGDSRDVAVAVEADTSHVHLVWTDEERSAPASRERDRNPGVHTTALASPEPPRHGRARRGPRPGRSPELR